jgi:hypothetical protein
MLGRVVGRDVEGVVGRVDGRFTEGVEGRVIDGVEGRVVGRVGLLGSDGRLEPPKLGRVLLLGSEPLLGRDRPPIDGRPLDDGRELGPDTDPKEGRELGRDMFEREGPDRDMLGREPPPRPRWAHAGASSPRRRLAPRSELAKNKA